jgi:hypothetical protein
MNASDDGGNDDISLYTTLLLPFSEKYPAVNSFVAQIWQSRDKRLKYNTMLQLMDKKMAYPDSLLNFFAGMDEYRYTLYSDLKERKESKLFPTKYNNHIDIARSALQDGESYRRPDSLVFLERMSITYEKKKGFIYFFKYKEDKEAETWKLAVAGMTPEQPDMFEFEDTAAAEVSLKLVYSSPTRRSYDHYSLYDFTELTNEKIIADKPLMPQLQKQLKKMLYSRKQGGSRFYVEDSEAGYDLSPFMNRK